MIFLTASSGTSKRNEDLGRPPFADAVALLKKDIALFEDTSRGEVRYIALVENNMRIWMVVFTERAGNFRIISFRRADKKETELYERSEKTRLPF